MMATVEATAGWLARLPPLFFALAFERSTPYLSTWPAHAGRYPGPWKRACHLEEGSGQRRLVGPASAGEVETETDGCRGVGSEIMPCKEGAGA